MKWQEKKLNEMYKCSKNALWEFKGFSEDEVIVWARLELDNYRRVLKILSKLPDDWYNNLNEHDGKFINTMIRREEAKEELK